MVNSKSEHVSVRLYERVTIRLSKKDRSMLEELASYHSDLQDEYVSVGGAIRKALKLAYKTMKEAKGLVTKKKRRRYPAVNRVNKATPVPGVVKETQRTDDVRLNDPHLEGFLRRNAAPVPDYPGIFSETQARAEWNRLQRADDLGGDTEKRLLARWPKAKEVPSDRSSKARSR